MIYRRTKPILSLTKLESQILEDPLKLFYNGIKSKETNSIQKDTQRIS